LLATYTVHSPTFGVQDTVAATPEAADAAAAAGGGTPLIAYAPYLLPLFLYSMFYGYRSDKENAARAESMQRMRGPPPPPPPPPSGTDGK
jgi:hypothetical protein